MKIWVIKLVTLDNSSRFFKETEMWKNRNVFLFNRAIFIETGYLIKWQIFGLAKLSKTKWYISMMFRKNKLILQETKKKTHNLTMSYAVLNVSFRFWLASAVPGEADSSGCFWKRSFKMIFLAKIRNVHSHHLFVPLYSWSDSIQVAAFPWPFSKHRSSFIARCHWGTEKHFVTVRRILKIWNVWGSLLQNHEEKD